MKNRIKELEQKIQKEIWRIQMIDYPTPNTNNELHKIGSALKIEKGNVFEVWKNLLENYAIKEVYINKDYEPYAIKREGKLKSFLNEKEVAFKAYKDQVIFEEDEIVKDDGLPYSVYTPYKNKWLQKYYNVKIQKFPSEALKDTFSYCSRPSQLLENTISRMFMDNSFQESLDFSLMSETIVISVGFDKSDSDFVGTWRPCNRRNGNSAVFVQTFACLEGPVSEDYANEMVTTGKPEYPIRYTIQQLVDDSLHVLMLSKRVGEEGKK